MRSLAFTLFAAAMIVHFRSDAALAQRPVAPAGYLVYYGSTSDPDRIRIYGVTESYVEMRRWVTEIQSHHGYKARVEEAKTEEELAAFIKFAKGYKASSQGSAPKAKRPTADVSLVGTRWAEVIKGDTNVVCQYEFRANGTLHAWSEAFDGPSGFERGTWTQSGNSITVRVGRTTQNYHLAGKAMTSDDGIYVLIKMNK